MVVRGSRHWWLTSGVMKRLVEHERGVLEARVDIAVGPLVGRMAHRQAALFFRGKVLVRPLQHGQLFWPAARRRPHPDIAVLARIRAARAQALQRIGREGQRLHVDLDLLDRFRAGQLIHGRHGQNRLALVHRLVGQRQFAPLVGLDHGSVVVHIIRVAGNIGRRQNRLHPRHRQRLLGVDALHARVRHRAQHQPAKQHPFRAKILGILRLPRHLRHQVVGRVILANQLVPRAERARLLLLGLHRTLLRVYPPWLRPSSAASRRDPVLACTRRRASSRPEFCV